MTTITRVQYVTEHYAHLQGLRLVPLGVPFIVSAAWRSGWLPWPRADSADAGVWFMLMLAAAVTVSYRIRASYQVRFGDVRPLPGRSGAATLIGSFVVFMALGWLQTRSEWPVSVPILFVGGVLCRLGLAAGGLRRHYLVLASLCLLFALVPSTEWSPRARAVSLDFVIGVSLIVAGLGDDHVLRRVLHPPDGDDDYASAL